MMCAICRPSGGPAAQLVAQLCTPPGLDGVERRNAEEMLGTLIRSTEEHSTCKDIAREFRERVQRSTDEGELLLVLQVMETTVRACSGKAGAKLFDAMAAKGVTAAVTELSLRASTTRVVRDRAAEVLTQWAHSVLWDDTPADGDGGGGSLSLTMARASSGARLYRKPG